MSELKPIIAKAADGKPLTRDEAKAAFNIMMSGDATPSQIAGLLMALAGRAAKPWMKSPVPLKLCARK